VATVVGRIREMLDSAGLEGELIVVDDGSSDATAARAREAGARVIPHPESLGYGEALKTGIRNAKNGIIVITDADETYPVEKIPELVAALDGADMAVGARTGENVAIPFLRKPFKWILRRLAQYIVQRKIPDLNSGLRAFRKELALKYFHLLPDGFSFTTTITVAAMCDGAVVEYIPIDYFRREGRSKISPKHFFSFMLLVMRLSTYFRPLRVFLPISIGCFLLGTVKLILDVIVAIDMSSSSGIPLLQLPVVSATALIFLLAGVQIALVGMVAEALARHGSVISSRLGGGEREDS